MWSVIEGPRAIKLTRKLAEEFAQMERCPHDREMQSARLEHIKTIVDSGHFRSPEWATAKCQETGKKYRVNGKHTSNVLSVCAVIPEVKVIITDYLCPTLKDVASLYATFDARFSSRTSKDIYLVYAQSVERIKDVVSSTITLAASGMSFATWEIGSFNHDVEERAQLLVRNPDFILWLSGILYGCTTEFKFIRRSGVVAAMFLTWCKDQKDAGTFWESVKTGSDPDNNHPTRVLQRKLMSVSGMSGSSRSLKEKASIHEMFVRCIRGWNLFRKGEKSGTLTYRSVDPTPEVI